MSEKLIACIKCSAPLDQPQTGRPRVYCSDPCRAAAAYELKRLQNRLSYLENRHSQLSHDPDHGFKDFHGRSRAQQLAALSEEIEEAEARLRLLLTSANGIREEVSV